MFKISLSKFITPSNYLFPLPFLVGCLFCFHVYLEGFVSFRRVHVLHISPLGALDLALVGNAKFRPLHCKTLFDPFGPNGIVSVSMACNLFNLISCFSIVRSLIAWWIKTK